MADLQLIELSDFHNYFDQETGQDSADTRLPENLSAQNFSNDGPLVLDTSAFNYIVKGLHPNIATADAGTAVLYNTSLAISVELVSMIRMRTFGGAADFYVGPATRITSDGIGCYSAELVWNAGGSGPGSFSLVIVRYDATTGTRNVLATLVDALTEYPAASGNFGNRFYAIGVQATGTGGTVTINAFLHLLFYTGDPTLTSEWDLSGMNSNLTVTLSTTDSTGSRHTSGAQGIRWRPATLSAVGTDRIVNQWGLFKDISGTRPTTPSINAVVYDNQQRMTVTIDGFEDTDSLETHQATRWLLYEDLKNTDLTFAAPLVDTGFLTGSLLSYTFSNLHPMKRYAVRVQLQDSDDDVSAWGEITGLEPDIGVDYTLHRGYGRNVHFRHRVAQDDFPVNGCFESNEANLNSLGTVFKLVVEAPGATSKGACVTRIGTVPTNESRRFAYRDLRFLGNGTNPVYDTIMGCFMQVVWPTGSGFHPFTRGTGQDANCYFMRKTSNGSNWEYALYRRTWNMTGVPGPGPSSIGNVSDTLLTTHTVPKATFGSVYGERVYLFHIRDTAGVGYLIPYINGQILGNYVANEQQGGNDPGHQFNGVHLDDTNGTWYLHQYGEVLPYQGLVPLPDAEVYPETDDQESAYHHPGPFMCAIDLGVQNIWYQQGGSWWVKAGGSAEDAYLIHWPVAYAHYQYSVTAQIYGNNGVVSRYRDPENLIRAYLSGGNTLVLEGLVGGAAAFSVSTSVTYVAGAPIVLQVYNDPNSNDILIRVFYNGDLIFPTSGSVYTYSDGQLGVLAIGRGGIAYTEAATSTDVQVADSFIIGAGLTVVEPDQPTATGTAGDATVKVSTVLSSSSFSDPDGGTHASSQWQITEYPAGNFSNPLWDSGADASNLTSVTVTPSLGTWRDPTDPGLDALTNYQYRVRHRDNTGLWSPWSSATTFTTSTPSSTSSPNQVAATYPGYPKPSQVFTETANFNTKISVFESGREQRRAKWTRQRRSWRLRYQNLTGSQMDAFWDFFIARNGALSFFHWINPRTDESVFVRFRNDSMSRELFEADLENTGLELVEVIL